MRVSLDWLKDFVDVKLAPKKLAESLTMSGLEVEAIETVGGDTVFELGITPNRSDCLSIIGVAREISAVTGAKFKTPVFKTTRGGRAGSPHGEGRMKDFVAVKIQHPKRCPRYAARIIRGVKIAPSPAWITKRLEACGIRAINNVVDATNYVMLEMGQPLHAFDLRFIRGGKINVRMAGENQKFKTLDEEERAILKNDLFICDAEGPVALAGVMGGGNSQVLETTKDILLESAFFEPTGIRRTSKRLGLASESSRRFERGVDPNQTLNALTRLTEIITQTAGGVPTADWADVYPAKILPKSITLDESEALRILGVKVSGLEIVKRLKSLGLDAKPLKKGGFSVKVPTFRPDIERPIDLIEEVARVGGLDKITETMPKIVMEKTIQPRSYKNEIAARSTLANAGFSETVLYGFTSKESLELFKELGIAEIKITNPLSNEQALMRTTLLTGLLDATSLNISRQLNDLRLFSLQPVYTKTAAGHEEPKRASGVLTGARFAGSWERSKETVDFYDAKGAVEIVLGALGLGDKISFEGEGAYGFMHPGSFAKVFCGGSIMGFVGELHPSVAAKWKIEKPVYVFELDFEEMAKLSDSATEKFEELCRYPFVERDLAIVLEDKIPAAEVLKTISELGIDILKSSRIFDVYRGKGIGDGHKSLALTVKFLKDDGTLKDEEVDAAFGNIIDKLKRKLGASLRV